MYFESPYDYTVSRDNSPRIFKDTCKRLDSFLKGFEKFDLLVDVDGSTIQIYKQEDRKVIVYDDYDIGVVFVKSDVDLGNVVVDVNKHKPYRAADILKTPNAKIAAMA